MWNIMRSHFELFVDCVMVESKFQISFIFSKILSKFLLHFIQSQKGFKIRTFPDL